MTYISNWYYLGRKQTVSHDPTVIEPGEARAIIFAKLRAQAPGVPWTSPDFSLVVDHVYALKAEQARERNARKRARTMELRAKAKSRAK